MNSHWLRDHWGRAIFLLGVGVLLAYRIFFPGQSVVDTGHINQDWPAQLIETIYLPNEAIESLAWKDRACLAAGTGAESIYVLKLDTAKSEQLHEIGRSAGANGLAWIPGKSLLISSHQDGNYRKWDTETQLPTAKIRVAAQMKSATRLALSPDGKYAIIGTSGGISKIMTIGNSRVENILPGHFSEVEDVAWSPDGTQILTAGFDQILRWDAKTFKPLGKLINSELGETTCLAYTPDGKVLAAGYRPKKAEASWHIGFWEMPNGRFLGQSEAHQDKVTALAWSKDGQNLYSGSHDRSVKCWAFGDVVPEDAPGHIAPWDFETYLADGLIRSLALSPDGERLAVGMTYGLGIVRLPPPMLANPRNGLSHPQFRPEPPKHKPDSPPVDDRTSPVIHVM